MNSKEIKVEPLFYIDDLIEIKENKHNIKAGLFRIDEVIVNVDRNGNYHISYFLDDMNGDCNDYNYEQTDLSTLVNSGLIIQKENPEYAKIIATVFDKNTNETTEEEIYVLKEDLNQNMTQYLVKRIPNHYNWDGQYITKNELEIVKFEIE